MSLSGVAAILQQMAENAGRQQMYRGAVIGNTISQATQIPAQMIEDRRRQAVIDREQAQRDTSLRYAGNEDARRQQDQDMQNAANALLAKKQNALKLGIAAGFGNSTNPKDFDEPTAIQTVIDAGFPDLAVNIRETHKNLLPKFTEFDPKKGEKDENGNIVRQPSPELKTATNDLALLAQNSNPFVRTLADNALTRAGHPAEKPLTYGQPQTVIIDGKRTLVRSGSDGNTYNLSGQQVDASQVRPDEHPPVLGGMNAMYAATDPKAIAAAIMRGEREQETGNLGRPIAAAVDTELAKAGYNKAGAIMDWQATKKHLASLNGSQQLRLNQAVNQLPDLLDTVDSLASQWKGGRFPILNKANLSAAKNGAYGSDVASVATKLDNQIADVNADLGVVYMGGNSPTDKALELAGKSLKGDWDEKVLHDMVKLAKNNVTIRRNSMANTGVSGASAENPYAAPSPAAAAETWVRDKNGKLVKQ